MKTGPIPMKSGSMRVGPVKSGPLKSAPMKSGSMEIGARKAGAIKTFASTAALLVFAAAVLALPAGADGGRVFRVDFSNPAVTPAVWTLTLYPDGSGHFHSERGSAPAPEPQVLEAPNVDRDIRLSGQFAERVFQGAHEHSVLDGNCESHMKVAFQGWKKLTYSGPDGKWSCEFNYSRDRQVQELGDSLMAVAGTIVEGARLEALHQHDRLGLDRELEFVADAVSDGRLVQICSIQDILERLVSDPEVMDRVRKRAQTLLAKKEK
jgi:hypothetical protein